MLSVRRQPGQRLGVEATFAPVVDHVFPAGRRFGPRQPTLGGENVIGKPAVHSFADRPQI